MSSGFEALYDGLTIGKIIGTLLERQKDSFVGSVVSN
jgi:hypothetical protein